MQVLKQDTFGVRIPMSLRTKRSNCRGVMAATRGTLHQAAYRNPISAVVTNLNAPFHHAVLL